MNAREYLSQIELNRARIATKRRVKAIADKVNAQYGTCVDVEANVEDYLAIVADVIDKINGMDRKEYVEVLTYRYVDGKNLLWISFKMNYSYDRIRHIHADAVRKFGEKYNLDTPEHKRNDKVM